MPLAGAGLIRVAIRAIVALDHGALAIVETFNALVAVAESAFRFIAARGG
jgi:hypothetical protein